jgi:hypothetical protein
MTEWFYDRNGQAQFFLYGDDRFVSKNGNNLGWLFRENLVYSLNGNHIGWLEEGVIRDGNGGVIAFLRDCKGSLPSRPGIGGRPGTPGIPGKPGRPGLSGIMGRPGRGGWSSRGIEDFFGEKL